MTENGDDQTHHLPPEITLCVAKARGNDMEVFTIDDPVSTGYDSERIAQNSRIERRPAIIARCRCAEDVEFWFDCADRFRLAFKPYPFVVRSGGHQHEARSTDDGAIVLDLSLIKFIEVDDATDTVWIGSGARLEDVVAELCPDKLIPVGLCENVRAGGLTHGGGWGLNWRSDGMTIDKLVDVEIVLADGTRIESAATYDDELLPAIRGGGGGNFGVVTKLQFELTDRPAQTTPFTHSWKTEHRVAVAQAWAKLMQTAKPQLNSLCRFGVPGSKNAALTVTGLFYGSPEDCDAALQPLFDVCEPDGGGNLPDIPCSDAYAIFTGQPRGAQVLEALNTDLLQHQFALQLGPPGDGGPSPTCDGPHRHKVTSAFACDPATMIKDIHDFLVGQVDVAGASLYVSLHGMGGVGAEPARRSSYPWRDEVVLFQGQAWWNSATEDDACLDFICRLRESMSGQAKGAFISFPDEAQPRKMYYGDNFDELYRLKTEVYDIDDRLRYPLGLTWPEPEE